MHALSSPWARMGLLGVTLAIPLFALSTQGDVPVMSRHEHIFSSSGDALLCSTCHDGGVVTAVGRVNGPATTVFCRSCHDGILSGNDNTGRLAVTLAITGERRTVHPISVGFAPGSRAEQRFQQAGLTTRSGSQNGVDNLWFDGKVECVSCHAVHQENPRPNMLKTDKAHDTCMACHPM